MCKAIPWQSPRSNRPSHEQMIEATRSHTTWSMPLKEMECGKSLNLLLDRRQLLARSLVKRRRVSLKAAMTLSYKWSINWWTQPTLWSRQPRRCQRAASISASQRKDQKEATLLQHLTNFWMRAKQSHPDFQIRTQLIIGEVFHARTMPKIAPSWSAVKVVMPSIIKNWLRLWDAAWLSLSRS